MQTLLLILLVAPGAHAGKKEKTPEVAAPAPAAMPASDAIGTDGAPVFASPCGWEPGTRFRYQIESSEVRTQLGRPDVRTTYAMPAVLKVMSTEPERLVIGQAPTPLETVRMEVTGDPLREALMRATFAQLEGADVEVVVALDLRDGSRAVQNVDALVPVFEGVLDVMIAAMLAHDPDTPVDAIRRMLSAETMARAAGDELIPLLGLCLAPQARSPFEIEQPTMLGVPILLKGVVASSVDADGTLVSVESSEGDIPVAELVELMMSQIAPNAPEEAKAAVKALASAAPYRLKLETTIRIDPTDGWPESVVFHKTGGGMGTTFEEHKEWRRVR